MAYLAPDPLPCPHRTSIYEFPHLHFGNKVVILYMSASKNCDHNRSVHHCCCRCLLFCYIKVRWHSYRCYPIWLSCFICVILCLEIPKKFGVDAQSSKIGRNSCFVESYLGRLVERGRKARICVMLNFCFT